MKRKEARAILDGVGISNKFSLRTIDFSDLARCTRQFCIIKDWIPNRERYLAVKKAFRGTDVLLDFEA